MANNKIDLRPHYTFAYCSESMEFGCKHMLYYSKKDRTLHLLYETDEYGCIIGEAEDWELNIQIDEDEAKLLERVFDLLIDSYCIFQNRSETVWVVCDGSDCTVICGKKRAHYEVPCDLEPFESFDVLANQLLSLKNDTYQTDIHGIIRLAREVKVLLEDYINRNK